MCVLPVEVRFVLAVKAQQQSVEGKAPDPPASLNGPVLHVLGQLQNLQASLHIVTEAQQPPQGQGQLVHQTAPTTNTAQQNSCN